MNSGTENWRRLLEAQQQRGRGLSSDFSSSQSTTTSAAANQISSLTPADVPLSRSPQSPQSTASPSSAEPVQELRQTRTSPANLASSTSRANSSSNGTSSSSGAIGPTSANKQGCQSVSILLKKYLFLEPAIPANASGRKGSARSPLIKTYPFCLNLETREQYTCKMIERNLQGFDLLAVHHRLGSDCEEISNPHEVVMSPTAKTFFLIMPPTFGSVHNYLLHRKKLGEAEAVNIFKQIVKAVQHCHNKGVVLRDLKMGKFVFHDKERTLVRLDSLDEAVLLHDLSDDGLDDKHGCPNYVSPEKAQILHSAIMKYPGEATDMWSLGVMLYAMLVGRYPFMDDDPSRLFGKIRNARVKFPDHVTVHARCLIRCLLHKDPSKRPTCGDILNHVWVRQNEDIMSPGWAKDGPDVIR